MHRKDELRYPQEIILEVTNACNLQCRHCHYHGSGAPSRRKPGLMNRSVWEKVLDEIASWSVEVTLLTHGAGEPLLYPSLADLLREAKTIPHVQLGFMTNGMLLDREWAAALVALQVDWIAFSIDGVVPETHDYYRVGADLKVIEENVRRLVEEKRVRGSERPFLQFNMVAYPAIADQAAAYVETWLPAGGNVTISTFRPIGSRRLWKGPAPCAFRPCPLLYRQMVITWDGQAGLCCEDIHLDVPLGSVAQSSLRELFNSSSTLLQYRRAHERGSTDGLVLCDQCDVWGGDVRLESTELRLHGLPVRKIRTPAFEIYERIPEQQ